MIAQELIETITNCSNCKTYRTHYSFAISCLTVEIFSPLDQPSDFWPQNLLSWKKDYLLEIHLSNFLHTMNQILEYSAFHEISNKLIIIHYGCLPAHNTRFHIFSCHIQLWNYTQYVFFFMLFAVALHTFMAYNVNSETVCISRKPGVMGWKL